MQLDPNVEIVKENLKVVTQVTNGKTQHAKKVNNIKTAAIAV